MTRTWYLLIAALLPILLSASCRSGPAPGPEGTETRVLVVVNRAQPSSIALGREYARRRGIAPSHLVRLDLPAIEEISRTRFEELLLEPLSRWWRRQSSGSRPHFVLLMPGIPHRIQGDGGLGGRRASVDSELCFLPRRASGQSHRLEGRLANPYFRPGPPYPPFESGEYGLCLVTRLAGWRAEDAGRLIDLSLAAAGFDPSIETPGLLLLDERAGSSPGNQWLRSAAERVQALLDESGSRPLPVVVVLDTLPSFSRSPGPFIGYASWGSNDGDYRREVTRSWRPGALATTFVSSSGRTFQQPPPGWSPGPSSDSSREFAGSTQSLIGDLLHSGATGAAGNAYEPYLDGCVRPDVLFPAYLSGRNLAEAFYLALPYLSWQSVIVGDPLCAPFGPAAP